MGHKVKQSSVNSRVDFFYHFFRNTLLINLPILVISAIVLSSIHSSATGSSSGSGTDSLTISISSACTLSSTVNTEHSDNVKAGTYKDDIGKTTIKTTCNDNNGYSIYANGYSNNEEGNNRLINTLSSSNVIETGLNTSGDTSSWAMKLDNIENDPSPTPPVIKSAYDDTYGLIPSNWTKVLSLPSGSTDMSLGSSFTTTYAVYANSRQYAGTYQGQVKYVLAHPSYQPYIYYMQEVDKWKNTLALEQSVQAIDLRDGKSYWVTKLKDGNIWMTQNLDLDIGGANTAPLNSTNTDISINPNVYTSGSIYSDYNVSNDVYTWNPASSANTTSHIISGANVSGWSNQNTLPYSAEGGDIYYYTSNSSSGDTTYNSLATCIQNSHTEAECKHYHRGNYYNWTAAIASNASGNISNNYANAANSICPKGWRLPIANSDNQTTYEFGDLLYTYYGITQAKYKEGDVTNSVSYTSDGFVNIRKSPLWFVRSGRIYNSALGDVAVHSSYWSSTVVSNNNAYSLAFLDSGVWPSMSFDRNLGRSVRCIAR